MTCANLGPFCDGELSAPDADAFRAHLPNCEACSRGVQALMQLSARISTLPPFSDVAVQPQWGGLPVVEMPRESWLRRAWRWLSW